MITALIQQNKQDKINIQHVKTILSTTLAIISSATINAGEIWNKAPKEVKTKLGFDMELYSNANTSSYTFVDSVIRFYKDNLKGKIKQSAADRDKNEETLTKDEEKALFSSNTYGNGKYPSRQEQDELNRIRVIARAKCFKIGLVPFIKSREELVIPAYEKMTEEERAKLNQYIQEFDFNYIINGIYPNYGAQSVPQTREQKFGEKHKNLLKDSPIDAFVPKDKPYFDNIIARDIGRRNAVVAFSYNGKEEERKAKTDRIRGTFLFFKNVIAYGDDAIILDKAKEEDAFVPPAVK